MSAPLLAADAARVAVDGVTSTGALSFATTGDRALFVGDTAALFAALGGVPLGARAPGLAGRSADPRWVPAPPDPDADAPRGEARVASGSLRLLGRDVARGDHLAVVGVAAADVPLPPRWTPVEYVAWSARLGGARARAAADLARAALALVGLDRAQKRLLSTFVPPERRALALAAAVVLAPPALVVEAPLAGLEGAGAAFVLGALAAATDGRAAVVSAARLDAATPESALAAGATFLGVLAGGELVAAGDPAALLAGARTYAITVRTNADALRDALRERGLELVGAPPRCTVALPEGATTADVLAAAAAARAAVVDLAPLL